MDGIIAVMGLSKEKTIALFELFIDIQSSVY
jgi:hypothetical protein